MSDQIEFTCIDCGGEVSRERTWVDVDGVTPQRCVMCTLARLGGDRA